MYKEAKEIIVACRHMDRDMSERSRNLGSRIANFISSDREVKARLLCILRN